MPVRIASRSVWAGLLAVAAVSNAHARSLREQLGASSLTVGLAGGSAFDALAANIRESLKLTVHCPNYLERVGL